MALAGLFVVGSQLALAWALTVGTFQWHDPLYHLQAERYRTQRTQFALHQPEQVLLLGSSRVLFGVQSAALNSTLPRMVGRPLRVFNFGIPGAGPLTQNVYLRRLLAEGLRPQWLLLEVMPPMLADRPQPAETRWLSADRLRADELKELRHSGWSLAPAPTADWLPLVQYRHELLRAWAPAYLPAERQIMPQGLDATGAGRNTQPAPTPTGYRIGLRNARAQYAEVFADYAPGGAAAAVLHDTVQLAQRHGIPVALLVCPEANDFRAWYGDAGNARWQRWLAEVSTAWQVPVVDGREWVADCGFVDGHHLLGNGADVFTTRLGHWLQEWLQTDE